MPLDNNNSELDNFDTTDLYKQSALHQFIISAGFEQFRLQAIPGDASNREYYRVITLNNTYILMDASRDLASIKPFINIDNLLLNNDVRAPVIMKSDEKLGFLLLEDFGKDSFTKFLAYKPEEEAELYSAAISVLGQFSKINYDLNLPVLNENKLNSELEIFTQWYVENKMPKGIASKITAELFSIFNELYTQLGVYRQGLVLRDFMADNLFWLGSSNEDGSVGVIDFQDAALGSPVYDLVSLLEDARRDVSKEVVMKCKSEFQEYHRNVGEDAFEYVYAILAAQRNIKIIGIFHRLNLRDNKPRYLDYLPRVWGHINNNLKSPVLKDLKNWFEKYDLLSK